MPRWVDLSFHGVAIRLRDSAQGRHLVLQATGEKPICEADAAALKFERVDGEYLRSGSQVTMSELSAVYPQLSVREFSPEELVAAPPRQAVEAGLDAVVDVQPPSPLSAPAVPDAGVAAARMTPESPALRACTLSPMAFASQVTWLKGHGRWRAALDGVELDLGAAAGMCQRKAVPDKKMILLAHDELLRQSVAIDPTAGSINALCHHPRRAYPGPLSVGRKAEMNVMRLLAQLGIADRLMSDDDTHVKIQNKSYIDLDIERHAYSPNSRMRQGDLMLTHYARGNGDTWIDAEMVFGINAGRLWLRETASYNPFTGGESRNCDRSFANLFSRNLLDQGFGTGVIQVRDAAVAVDPSYAEPIVLVEGTSVEDQVQVQIKAVRTETGWRGDWDLTPRRGANFTHARASLFDDQAFASAQEAIDAGIKDLGRRIRDLSTLGEIGDCALGTSISRVYDRCRAVNAYRLMPEHDGEAPSCSRP